MPCIEMTGEVPTGLRAFEQYQAYNILDAAITAQLLPVMKAQLNANTATVYTRERRLLSLCLDISSKGFPIDQLALAELIRDLDRASQLALSRLHLFCDAVGGVRLNPNSWQQVESFFYDYLRIPPIWVWDHKKKLRKRGTDRDALEKLAETYPLAKPFCLAIFAYKEHTKMASVFKRGLEPITQNLRCQFSPTGTETGRMSSQQNPYGRGTNAQNLTDRVRQVITAPKGYCILNIDLKTAESIAVGYLAADRAYINACLTGDLHTAVARDNWKSLPWTGELKLDKAIAEQPFYRQFSYRDMAKRGGHGTNYYGTPPTMAKHLKIETKVVAEFQQNYFRAFPGIPRWHLETIARVQRDGVLVTPLGRERRFWGRPSDAATHREAIAFCPQSLVADVMNEGLMQVQAWLCSQRDVRRIAPAPLPDLRAQVHDSGVFLVPIEGLAEYAVEIQKRLLFPVDFGELGTMTIPSDLQVGKRWCKAPKKPTGSVLDEGLRDYTPGQALHF